MVTSRRVSAVWRVIELVSLETIWARRKMASIRFGIRAQDAVRSRPFITPLVTLQALRALHAFMTVVNAPPYTLQARYKPGQHLICNTQQLLRGQRKAHGLAWYSETAELVPTPLFPQTGSEVYLGNSSLARTNRRERGRILCIIHRFFGNKIFILTFTSKRRCLSLLCSPDGDVL
jgi:hypothetical protein